MDESETIRDELEKLRAENEALKKTASRGLPLKVSEKGCIHFGGCHNKQFGLTLYVSTVEYVYSIRDQVEAFIRANNGRLARK